LLPVIEGYAKTVFKYKNAANLRRPSFPTSGYFNYQSKYKMNQSCHQG
jgi:hypothetical protein